MSLLQETKVFHGELYVIGNVQITGTYYIPLIPNQQEVESEIANKIMIENGAGIIKIPDSNLEEFNVLLSDFYTTNNNSLIKSFIYNNCIDGIIFES